MWVFHGSAERFATTELRARGYRHPVFPGGVGNTFGDDAAFVQLIDDVETKLFQRLPDDTWFYPGHGDDSTIGAERPSLGEWRSRGW